MLDRWGRVLLQLRLWPLGWEPPGGHVAPGEDPARTVVRETREETGLEIEVQRLCGRYRFRGLRQDWDLVFRAQVVGGRPRRTREAVRIRWFLPDRLPRSIFPWYRQRIQDALADPEGPAPDRIQYVGLGTVLGHGRAILQDLVRWPGRTSSPRASP